jgi:uncharacterized protein (TIGR00369 family)
VAVHPLRNTQWGFETNCFGCEPGNERGLQIPFFHDDEAGLVFAEFTLGEEFSGAPAYLHGGITMTVLDEAMAWATIAVGGKFAVTREMRATFDRPVRVGRPYRVEARLTEQTDERFEAEGVVLDGRTRPCVRATAEFVVLTAKRATEVLGTKATGDDAKYVS